MRKSNKKNLSQTQDSSSQQNPVHSARIGDYTTRVYNGGSVPNNLGVASILEVVSKSKNQIGFVGTGEDTHNGQPGSVRTLMVHQDNVRKLTKAVVAEPGELTITVIDSEATANNNNNTVPKATISIIDDDEEIIIRNTYGGTQYSNLIRISKKETSMEFSSENSSRVFMFDEQGLRLGKNNQVVWGIDMDGNEIE